MKNFFKAIGNEFKSLGESFVKGDFKTRLSFVVMGGGQILRGQIVKGLIFLAIEVLFFLYLFVGIAGGVSGAYWMSMLPSLGLVGPGNTYDPVLDTYVYTYNDNSFKILLYGILTIFIICAFVLLWAGNVKSAYETQKAVMAGKPVMKFKDDLRHLVDEGFYKTLLTLPVTGIFIFTLLPLVFMILIAFTNYDGVHDGYVTNLFSWVGLQNFKTLLFSGGSTNSYASTFAGILGWTLVWAFFATFTNYFLGIIVAMMINKKGIRFKKMWRTIFVVTIAIPQFISLLYVSKMFDKSGIVNGFLMRAGILSEPIDFWGDSERYWIARLLVILINIWIGVPYLMLIATGILMNIPQDLYEAARIDGANAVQQFRHITMPYMLFITAPYLLTSFTGNINNFNVIYLLSAGAPTNSAASSASGSVGYTDLLITWLFKITTGADASYYMASVIGIIVFVVCAVITLVVYGVLPSTRNEEDMQ